MATDETSPKGPPSGALPVELLGLEHVQLRVIEPAASARIYVNRNLRLDAIAWVGFDMDYTLARYRQREMDRLSIEATVEKLIEEGYPTSLRSAHFDAGFAIRGLHVDRVHGNILKMDRYRYVKRAYHGMRPLSREERHRLYDVRPVDVGGSRFHWVDTLYALPEVAIYSGIVEHHERTLGEGAPLDYGKTFDDVRRCIDLAHQDGSINDAIARDFPRYVERDPELPNTLHRLRSAGKRLFLLSNSPPKTTDRMMRFLFGEAHPLYPSWRSSFDLVVCAAKKPAFFTEPDLPLFALDASLERETRVTDFAMNGFYRGGSLAPLERFFGVGGDRILYAGDHIYGDVLRAKKQSAWRTMMVLQEMSHELEATEGVRPLLTRLEELARLAEGLVEDVHAATRRLRGLDDLEQGCTPDAAGLATLRASCAHRLTELREQLAAVEHEQDELEEAIERAFHPAWGSVFKAGLEVSSLGDQIEQWACLYTERVSNLSRYSPTHYFRGPLDRMPHER